MARYLILLLLPAVVACASIGQTTVQNSSRPLGNGIIHSMFMAVDGIRLGEGVWVPPADTAYRVAAGKRTLVVRVVHDPRKGYLSLSQFEACVPVPVALKRERVYVAEANLKNDVVSVTVKDRSTGELAGEAARANMVPLDPVKSCALDVPGK